MYLGSYVVGGLRRSFKVPAAYHPSMDGWMLYFFPPGRLGRAPVFWPPEGRG